MRLQPADIRGYLLGTATEQVRTAIEQAYLSDDVAIDEVEAEEDALIEGYLDGTLAADERERFDRHYLASPFRRRRVDGVRRLIAAAAQPDAREQPPAPPVRRWLRPQAWAALAAAAGIIIAARLWLPARHKSAPPPQTAGQTPPATPPPVATPAPAPALVAFSLSPMAVRGAQDVPPLSIPQGTTAVSLRLEGERQLSRPGRMQLVVRTVDGIERWRGSATLPANAAPGVLAEAEVPASVLATDDYILELLDSGSGAPRPIASYFLRVRR